jgi:hypothetical protein
MSFFWIINPNAQPQYKNKPRIKQYQMLDMILIALVIGLLNSVIGAPFCKGFNKNGVKNRGLYQNFDSICNKNDVLDPLKYHF